LTLLFYVEVGFMSKKIAVGLRLDEIQLDQLKNFSKRKGGSPLSHHIRIAIAEYLEKYDNTG
jgi:metal-responsive CopG/Arc/MetJ family transcriptional regulator